LNKRLMEPLRGFKNIKRNTVLTLMQPLRGS
jgi:hypothetical protein